MKKNYYMQSAFMTALYEYLLIISPVLIYVCIEALHKDNISFILFSPEWSIATIFLLFQGNALYRGFLKKTGKEINDHFLGVIVLLSFIIALLTLINSYLALHENTNLSISIRLLLFISTSVCFLLAVTSSKYYLYTNGNK